jgi:hypothetical protein
MDVNPFEDPLDDHGEDPFDKLFRDSRAVSPVGAGDAFGLPSSLDGMSGLFDPFSAPGGRTDGGFYTLASLPSSPVEDPVEDLVDDQEARPPVGQPGQPVNDAENIDDGIGGRYMIIAASPSPLVSDAWKNWNPIIPTWPKNADDSRRDNGQRKFDENEVCRKEVFSIIGGWYYMYQGFFRNVNTRELTRCGATALAAKVAVMGLRAWDPMGGVANIVTVQMYNSYGFEGALDGLQWIYGMPCEEMVYLMLHHTHIARAFFCMWFMFRFPDIVENPGHRRGSANYRHWYDHFAEWTQGIWKLGGWITLSDTNEYTCIDVGYDEEYVFTVGDVPSAHFDICALIHLAVATNVELAPFCAKIGTLLFTNRRTTGLIAASILMKQQNPNHVAEWSESPAHVRHVVDMIIRLRLPFFTRPSKRASKQVIAPNEGYGGKKKPKTNKKNDVNDNDSSEIGEGSGDPSG